MKKIQVNLLIHTTPFVVICSSGLLCLAIFKWASTLIPDQEKKGGQEKVY